MPSTRTDRRISLREASGDSLISLDVESAARITQLGIASVSPASVNDWRVTNVSKVGIVRVGDIELSIKPKVPLERLFYMLAVGEGWGDWFDSSVSVETVDDLYPAIAESFASASDRLLRGGALRSYREMRSAEPAIRGKWMVTQQIRKRQGSPLPVELQYDEFTIDIPENQLLHAAALRLLRFGYLPDGVRARLMCVSRQLVDVTRLGGGQVIPSVTFDRRNERYRPAVALAELILSNGSLDHRVGTTESMGFLLDMPRVFERFIEAEVIRAARAFGGRIIPQQSAHLDLGGNVEIRPDLVWHSEGRVRAVFDAKYKVEKPAGFPNADVYQMLAYCVRHELSTGHLIYASGNDVAARYAIAQAGIEIYCHSIALDRTPDNIAGQIDRVMAMGVASSIS